jgi:hypothetical protein
MADKKPDFTVSDRRLFTPEGDLRRDVGDEEEVATAPAPQEGTVAEVEAQAASAGAIPQQEEHMPPPSAAEQQAQADAYQQSAREMDSRLKRDLGGKAHDLQMTFERFLASLYMSALLQLGLVAEQGGHPQIDLIGARQTIDTIGILSEKTKGNLTSHEEAFLQNVLYELRMAYLEVTNALAKGPQPGTEPGPRPQ